MRDKVDVMITYHGNQMTVSGYFSAGSMGDYENPPEPAEFDIVSIEMEDPSNVFDLLSIANGNADFFSEITNLCIEQAEYEY